MKEQQDKYIDDVDLFFSLNPHGWSECYIRLPGKLYILALTHIFDNPIEVLLSHMTGLLRGENFVSFTWKDEPGVHECSFTREADQHHKLKITISNAFQLNTNGKHVMEDITFTVKEFVFMTNVLHEMEKISQLTTEKTYREDRDKYPYDAFKEFKQAYLIKYQR